MIASEVPLLGRSASESGVAWPERFVIYLQAQAQVPGEHGIRRATRRRDPILARSAICVHRGVSLLLSVYCQCTAAARAATVEIHPHTLHACTAAADSSEEGCL